MSEKIRVVIIGGGAAGFFAAINTAENAKTAGRKIDIQILEASDSVLKKVRISGGGRCNVTHHQFDSRKFCENYPRGQRELMSVMQRFQATDTIAWFKQRGIRIVAEDDGRMFPDTNSSETIIKCFTNAASALGVKVHMRHSVKAVDKLATGKFQVTLATGDVLSADKVMIATGSSPMGYGLAKGLGHSITQLAPSLFSFKIEDSLLKGLEGLSFKNSFTSLEVGDTSFKERGPLLITHWGLSGPAVLKISAWAAREMLKAGYKAKLLVNWLGLKNQDAAVQLVNDLKNSNIKSKLANAHPPELPNRFWSRLLMKAELSDEKRWADLSNKEIIRLAQWLVAAEFQVSGKNRYKDEFVECGGVDLKEVNFKTMESKICPGLFFAGEVLDIDGITGGFNFQNAWSGGWIAATSLCL